ncbi:hypothetical protein [Halobaculum sp. D14]|uniref:hypothetical protein n=1 Tax=unclassified Halobaculum TaxID=2640896 RepID=UPI003EBC1E72
MPQVRAEALLGGADELLEEPRRVVDPNRLGDPGDVLGDGARLVAVEEVPLAHLDLAPDERERLPHLLGDRRTIYVHHVE